MSSLVILAALVSEIKKSHTNSGQNPTPRLLSEWVTIIIIIIIIKIIIIIMNHDDNDNIYFNPAVQLRYVN